MRQKSGPEKQPAEDAIKDIRCYLARLCNEGLLVKLGYGRYRAAVPKGALMRDTKGS